MAIPVVIQSLVHMDVEEGNVCSVFDLDSSEGRVWLECVTSFRFVPRDDSKAYTVRKESGIYWYGCRKVAGKVRKKYLGKSSEVTVGKLEEIAEALEISPVPPVNKVAEAVRQDVQVAQEVTQVAEVTEDRLTALELEVANLRKALEALQEALPGKFETGSSEELPKVDSKVAEELQNELGNLKTENKKLRADYDALLESSTVVTEKLDQEVQKLRSQIETDKIRWDELREELDDREETCAELRSELSKLKQKSVAASKDLPEAADLLNQLKAKRKKSKADLTDLETILEILES